MRSGPSDPATHTGVQPATLDNCTTSRPHDPTKSMKRSHEPSEERRDVQRRTMQVHVVERSSPEEAPLRTRRDAAPPRQKDSQHSCNGLCSESGERYIRAYTLMAGVRNTLPEGLLMTFINTTSADVDLVWKDYDGEDINLIKIRPGQTHRFSALTCHNFCCRNTNTNQPYLLNSEYLCVGKSLFGQWKNHKIYIRPPKNPQTLTKMTLNTVAASLNSYYAGFKLSLPAKIKQELLDINLKLSHKVYYSKNGEPGQYRKMYANKDDGPLIYPSGLDWSPFDDLGLNE